MTHGRGQPLVVLQKLSTSESPHSNRTWHSNVDGDDKASIFTVPSDVLLRVLPCADLHSLVAGSATTMNGSLVDQALKHKTSMIQYLGTGL
jgi:hypothetical protein